MNHSIRGRWLLPVLALAALIALSPATAEAQSGSSGVANVTLNMPDLVVLHYFSSVDVTIDLADLQAAVGFGTGANVNVDEGAGSGTTSSWTVDLAMSPDAAGAGVASTNLELTNAWAVRAISRGATQTRISITSDATLTGANGGTIDIVPGVQVNGGGYAASQDFDPLGMGTAQAGDVQLNLDMSDATNSGAYTGTYTLSVTNL